MSKYNFKEFDTVNPDGSWGKCLSHVQKDSTVLEFGCASGYMTRYMKEKLGCHVDIVEIDKEDFDKASKYACNGWQGDIETMGWYKTFRGNRYDHIMFADVLEHLKDPMAVLKDAADLLEEGGTIIASIPNICHNDILIKMFYDCFTYTDLGLLDSTHVHFWGIRDFLVQCEAVGLHVKECNCVAVRTGQTEQRLPLDQVSGELIKLLLDREFGEAYQYVFVIEKKG